MISVCTRINCPKRFYFGSEEDEDSITLLCPNCGKVHFDSHKRKKRLLRQFRLIVVFIPLVIFWFFFKPEFVKLFEAKNSSNYVQNSNKSDVDKTGELTYTQLLDSTNVLMRSPEAFDLERSEKLLKAAVQMKDSEGLNSTVKDRRVISDIRNYAVDMLESGKELPTGMTSERDIVFSKIVRLLDDL